MSVNVLLVILLAPLIGALIAGLLGKVVGRTGVSILTIFLMSVSFLLSMLVLHASMVSGFAVNQALYTFASIAHLNFSIGLLVDRLSAFMMVVVTFVALLVHVYSIGYMKDDPGYTRFFSYISGFTFAMLALVMANNFLLLFFGWEGVGLFSYLLIGFWFDRETANVAAMRAFIANRVGDLGFLLGIAMVLTYFNTLDYATVFAAMPALAVHSSTVITLMCLLLFTGAVGKSAQLPLHIWLEGSMEGPTPISALIHAATMVTAGVFMVARLSPMFEFSDIALSTVLVIGALTAFLMGLLGLVQNDIKRVIAYSTLSQLGYMMAAQGASLYPVGLFHLMTHAAFKALLFLAAGSVIIALHHEQDMQKMGGLYKKLPLTYIAMLIGALALCGIPPFSGFFSKDMLIEGVGNSTVYGHTFAYLLLLLSTGVTALYTFRMFFLTFHGKPRMDKEIFEQVHETPWSMLLPLIVLIVPSVVMGFIFYQPLLNGFFANAIFILPTHTAIAHFSTQDGPWYFALTHLFSLPVVLAILGIIVSYVFYVARPALLPQFLSRVQPLQKILAHKYGIDALYDLVFVGGARALGLAFLRIGDVFIIDRTLVEGTGQGTLFLGLNLRKIQSGFIHHYAFFMVLGLIILLALMLLIG